MVACRMEELHQLHQPVLLTEVIANLAIQADGIYVDATFGRGGHAQAILDKLGPHGRLLAFDKDAEAIAHAQKQLGTDSRFAVHHGSFAELQQVLEKQGLMGKINGILLDLGVSSPQLDDPERGFSFLRSGKLDMRMNVTQGIDAATWLATISETELANVLWEYGEERYSRRIARAIIVARQETAITTTTQLAEIIAAAHPAWEKGKNPATRSFQAIRIAINHELDELKSVLMQCLKSLKVGGRLLVISFHSLEDRLVKHFIQDQERGESFPAGLPIKHERIHSTMKRIGRAMKPSAQEIAMNPRARSAVLRIAEKIL